MAATLLDLPVELIQRTGSYLSKKDLKSVRLVCQEFKQSTFKYYATQVFGTLWTDLSFRSLIKLTYISETEDFRKHVKQLVILQNVIGVKSTPTRSSRERLQSITSQLNIRAEAYRWLQNLLLERLIYCRTFEIAFEGQPYGNFEHFFPRHLFSFLIFLTESHNLSPKSITVSQPPLPDDLIDHGCTKWSLTNLRSLHLCDEAALFLSLNSGESVEQQLREPQPRNETAWQQLHELVLEFPIAYFHVKGAMHLVRKATQLKKLVLSSALSVSRPLEKRYFNPTFLPPRLQELHLEGFRVSSSVLQDAMLHCRDTLSTITLFHITTSPENAFRSWKAIIGTLRSLPTLNLVHIQNPRGTHPLQVLAVPVSFGFSFYGRASDSLARRNRYCYLVHDPHWNFYPPAPEGPDGTDDVSMACLLARTQTRTYAGIEEGLKRLDMCLERLPVWAENVVNPFDVIAASR